MTPLKTLYVDVEGQGSKWVARIGPVQGDECATPKKAVTALGRKLPLTEFSIAPVFRESVWILSFQEHHIKPLPPAPPPVHPPPPVPPPPPPAPKPTPDPPKPEVKLHPAMNPYEIYLGSSGERTTALYKHLHTLGPVGVIAVNLFRASKCSARAKVYRGRGYRDEAYQRKQWSMDNLCRELGVHGPALGITYGWQLDPDQTVHNHVLYVEIPTGQVSFHTDIRGAGPIYKGHWDGVKLVSGQRICSWICTLLAMPDKKIVVDEPTPACEGGIEDGHV